MAKNEIKVVQLTILLPLEVSNNLSEKISKLVWLDSNFLALADSVELSSDVSSFSINCGTNGITISSKSALLRPPRS
ncbi:hypothetical protein TNCV_3162691 [Trichonephila clavipes]|nr:hypothetical protein TNCV_3162691 [Trichonephila clavipes]